MCPDAEPGEMCPEPAASSTTQRELVPEEDAVVPARACVFERIKNHKKDGGECGSCARPFVRNTLFRKCAGCCTT
eukprot:8202153-Heterocapsa_arctica.AAC.1